MMSADLCKGDVTPKISDFFLIRSLIYAPVRCDFALILALILSHIYSDHVFFFSLCFVWFDRLFRFPPWHRRLSLRYVCEGLVRMEEYLSLNSPGLMCLHDCFSLSSSPIPLLFRFSLLSVIESITGYLCRRQL
ncbi:hypothetical protein QOT17_015450 [Balamuthia mandrillaris]